MLVGFQFRAREKTVSDSIMVVGDAARFVNPMTGGGINFAMRSGKIAGEVGAEAVWREIRRRAI